MTEALAATIAGTEASRMEIDRGGPSYSIVTVEEVCNEYVDGASPDIFLIVGADLVPELGSWERPADLAQLVTLVVMSRPGATRPPSPPGWMLRWIDGPQIDVSSSWLREALAAGENVEGLVPEEVMHCIIRRGLYAVDR
jgi:nicotinate-nucleotide adenylyltransferase